MNEDTHDADSDSIDGESGTGDGLFAHQCENGHLTYPAHSRCPECKAPQTETVDLSNRRGNVLTWTTVSASPVGVREPNTIAIVEFVVDDRQVRLTGGTTDSVEVGQSVRPVYVDELRDPDVGIRDRRSQSWSGYRFEPIE